MIILKPNWEEGIKMHHETRKTDYQVKAKWSLQYGQPESFGTSKGYNEKSLTATQQIKELTKLILSGQAKVSE